MNQTHAHTASGADPNAGRAGDQPSMEAGRTPRVSIGMPVYNGMSHMPRAAQSLLGQSFEDFEFIIVDNASTDGSYEFACSLTGDPRVQVHRNDSNIGPIANFLRVRDLARGEYFMWAAADDDWEPDFVARLVAELDRHPDAGVAMTATRIIRAEKNRSDVIVSFAGPLDPATMGPLRLAWQVGKLGSAFKQVKYKYNLYIYGLFRRELLNKISIIDGWAQDRVLAAEFALATTFRYVDEVLYHRHMHAQKHEVRYPETGYSRLVSMGFRGDLRFLRSLFRTLVQSRIVPTRRKLLAPVIVGRFSASLFYDRFFYPRITAWKKWLKRVRKKKLQKKKPRTT